MHRTETHSTTNAQNGREPVGVAALFVSMSKKAKARKVSSGIAL